MGPVQINFSPNGTYPRLFASRRVFAAPCLDPKIWPLLRKSSDATCSCSAFGCPKLRLEAWRHVPDLPKGP